MRREKQLGPMPTISWLLSRHNYSRIIDVLRDSEIHPEIPLLWYDPPLTRLPKCPAIDIVHSVDDTLRLYSLYVFTSVTSRFDGECWSRSNATMILASNIGFSNSIKNYNRNFSTRHESSASFSILQTTVSKKDI